MEIQLVAKKDILLNKLLMEDILLQDIPQALDKEDGMFIF